MAEANSYWEISQTKPGQAKWAAWFSKSKRQNRAARLADISKANIDITRGIMEQAKSLQKKGNRKESNALLEIAERLVDNNDKVLEVASELRNDEK